MRKLQATLGGAGSLAIVSGSLIHVVLRPELTQPQALRELWPFWAIGAGLMAMSAALALFEEKRVP